MTAFPDIATAFGDGAVVTKSDMRDLANATEERIGGLPADYSSYAGLQPPAIVNVDGDGLKVAGSGDLINFNGAETFNQLARGFRHKTVTATVDAGIIALNLNNGAAIVITLDDDLNEDGITLSNQKDNYCEIVIKIQQDGTGGRLINSGSAVADAFPDSDFYFPSPVTMPSGANKYVVLAGFRFSNSEPYVMKLIHTEA